VSELLGLHGSRWIDESPPFRRMMVGARNTSQPRTQEQKHLLNRLVSTFRPERHPIPLECLLLPKWNLPIHPSPTSVPKKGHTQRSLSLPTPLRSTAPATSEWRTHFRPGSPTHRGRPCPLRHSRPQDNVPIFSARASTQYSMPASRYLSLARSSTKMQSCHTLQQRIPRTNPWTSATIPTIHGAHSTATRDHIDIDFVGWAR
jgi:hypothetical protein